MEVRDADADPGLTVVEPLFKTAVALHKQARLAEADSLYRQVLAKAPTHAQATHHLGVLALQRGQTSSAIELLQTALAALDTDGAIHANYARALKNSGRLDEALLSIDRALALDPRLVGAWVDRANLLLDSKRPAEALVSMERALEVNPDEPHALNGVGNALLDLNETEQALQYFSRAIERAPRVADFHLNRALAQARLQRPSAALADCRRARELGCRSAQLHLVEGNALLDLGYAMEALDAFSSAMELDPSLANAWHSRGTALVALGDHELALACFERCLELTPGSAEPPPLQLDARFNRGSALYELGRHAEAWESFEQLALLAPDRAFVRGCLLHARLMHCCWRDYEVCAARITEAVDRGQPADVPLRFLAISASPAAQLRCARSYVTEMQPASPVKRVALASRAHERVRVAYLSSDFGSHPVGRLIVAAMECHDRSRFETYALSFGVDDGSDTRRRLQGAFEHFLDFSGAEDAQVAARLAELTPDIAVDLNGHTAGGRGRLLAARLAPLQLTWLGFPGTLGVDYMDYIVADRHVIPEHARAHYSEQAIYLPDTCLPADWAAPAASPPPRGAVGLPERGVVFCCFNTPGKILPPLFDAWARILEQVPDSVLWLRLDAEVARQHLQREADERGIARSRLVFAPSVSAPAAHSARLQLADLLLDTYPYNAHSTALDALAAGVPVMTLRGDSFASRAATSLLHTLGLGQLSVDTLEAYESLAVDLARSPGALAQLRAHLQEMRARTPLFDPARFCRHLEVAYLAIWARHQRGEPPATLWVQPEPRP